MKACAAPTTIRTTSCAPRCWPIRPTIPPTPVPIIAQYSVLFRDGIVYCAANGGGFDRVLCYYDLPSNTHQPLLPMNVGAFDASGERIYYASYGSNFASAYPKPVVHISKCTARARLRFRIYNYNITSYPTGTNFITTIGNFSTSSYIVFKNLLQGAFPQNGAILQPIAGGDVWDIDVDANIVNSAYYGSLLNLIEPYSKLYATTVQPGVNIIYVAIYLDYLVTTFEVTAGYTQKFQSLFDGINAQ